jgi:arylsulfatase
VTRAAAFLETFVKYPPSQPPASFSVDQIVEGVKKRIEEQRRRQKQ